MESIGVSSIGSVEKSQPQIKHEQLQRSQQETCALEGLGCLGVFHSLSSWWRRHNDVMSIPQFLSSFHFCEWNACNVLYIYIYIRMFNNVQAQPFAGLLEWLYVCALLPPPLKRGRRHQGVSPFYLYDIHVILHLYDMFMIFI